MSLPVITGVPPETWEQILQILNQFGVTVWDLTQQGITTWEGAGGLQEYLLNHGWEVKEVWEMKYMWFQTGAGDVTQSNALVQYVGNKVTIAGTAGAEYVNHFTFGETTLGKLKKGIIFGCIFALLVSTLDPTLIDDTLKDRLNAVIDSFADANGDVPVVVDGDGKIYYHEDMINALRQELIDAGVYSVNPEPPQDIGENIIFSQRQSSGTYSGTISKTNFNNYKNTINFYDYYVADNSGKIAKYVSDGSNLYEIKMVGITFAPQGSGHISSIFILSDDNLPLLSSMDLYFFDADGQYISGTSSSSSEYTVTFNGVTKTFRGLTFSASGYPQYYDNPVIASNMNSMADPNSCMFASMFGESGGGVEGITVSDDLISRGVGNAQTALEDIFPSYSTDKVTTINPTDEDITASDNWYPISTSDTNVWTDGITEQQSETATDGDVTPDIQDQIADAVKEILEDYYRDPTDPTVINWPQIPVSDSGDTPPEDPTLLSGAANGLWTIYNPSLAEVHAFGAWLWSSSILDQITRMFNSPIDAVIGFHMIYCTPTTGSSKNIMAGFLDSGVSAAEVTNQYVDIDCGQVSVDEYYGNILDYTNTRISIFLPFCGFFPLDTAVVMGSVLEVTYRVDVLTGTCLAQVKVIKENSAAVMYSFSGNCSVQVPLTATTYTGMVGALVSTLSAGASLMTGNMIGAGASAMRAMTAGMTGLSGVRQSGSMGANAGALGIRTPYLIITHPVQANAADFDTIQGLPANKTVRLGDVTGFTRVYACHLDAISGATADEIEQIRELLYNGVIL